MMTTVILITKMLVMIMMVVEGRKEMFYLTTHSTYFIYGYMASDIWLRTIPIVRKESRCGHIGYSFRLAARVLLYATSHRQDSTYYGLCYTSHGALAGTTNNSMDPHHEGSIRRPIAHDGGDDDDVDDGDNDDDSDLIMMVVMVNDIGPNRQ